MGRKKEKEECKHGKDVQKPAKNINEQKTYSTVSVSRPQQAGSSKEAFQVQIGSDIEAALLELIKNALTASESSGRISQRLNARKLTDMYTSLRAANFQPSQVEQAMKAIIRHGGDVIDALDWLCLNLPNDQLPDGFSQALQEEEMKHRQPFNEQLQLEQKTVECDIKAVIPKSKRVNEEKNEVADDAGKDWILQYLETQLESDVDSDEDGEQKEPTVQETPDVDETSSDRYLELTARLLDARSQALSPDTDPEGQHKLAETIKQIVSEMKKLEQLPDFDPRVKLKDVYSEIADAATEKDTNDTTDGLLDEASLSLFDDNHASHNVATIEKSAAVVERRSFTYTRQQWSGKSPKQFLTDWTRKNLPKTSSMSFDRVQISGGWWKARCKITRKTKDGDLIVCPDIACDNLKDAEHLASMLALYELCRGQRVHMLLPPPYRDVWLEWQKHEEQAKRQAAVEDVRPRDEFIARLLSDLKMETSSTLKPAVKKDDVCDSWEDRESDDEELEDANHKQESDVNSAAESRSTRFPADRLTRIMHKNRCNDIYRTLLNDRQHLPVFQHRDDILSQFRGQNVFIVASNTGSGKSTQVPQFLLEEILSTAAGDADVRHIICTEPRRISAVSLAERVSSEMGELKGPGQWDSLCGYQIRFETRRSLSTRLTYCTTGILLRRLHDDPNLSDAACIIVDEVHERSVESDFLLIHLRRLSSIRPDLRIVLMSATLDAQKFSTYFGGCPVLNIPGRSFPVEVYHLEDIIEKTGYTIAEDSQYSLQLNHLIKIEHARVTVSGHGGTKVTRELTWSKDNISTIDQSDLDPVRYSLVVRNTVTRINPGIVNLDLIVDILHLIDSSPEFSSVNGAVLIFVPGLFHIVNLLDILETDQVFGDDKRYLLLPLHSSLSSAEQSKVFAIPRDGVRKIVVSTNVAETGVTIPDVVFVIDSGRVKEKRYNEATQMSQLLEVSVSRASAQQRCGRAGRTREGFCFRLYSSPMYQRFASYAVPEIMRVPLEELCLHIMKCGLGSPSEFLSSALDPPGRPAITRAMSILHEIGACYHDEATKLPSLTALGHHLALLPIDVRLAKMLIYGAMLGCLEPAAIMAAAMMDKSPFVTSFDRRSQSDAAKSHLALENSDHLTLYNAFVSWKAAKKLGSSAEKNYCDRNFLKRMSLIEIENVSNELIKMVKSSGFNTSLADMLRVWKSPVLSGAFKDVTDIVAGPPSPGLSAILKAVLTAGLYPFVGRMEYVVPVDAAANPVQRACVVQTVQGEALIHPSSVNRFLATSGWIVYQEKVRSSQNIYLRDVSQVCSSSLLLFGGAIDIQHQQQLVTIDQWITLKAPAKTGVIFKETRHLIGQLLLQKLENPSLNLADQPLVRILLELIVSEVNQKL